MRILITGGAGFIGSNLVKKLLKGKQEVTAIDNLITGRGENITPYLPNKSFTFIEHDITQPLPKSLLETRIDQIYHLACPTGVPNLTRLAEEMILTCSLGTRNVLEFARQTNTRFLFTSSSEVYGNPQTSPQNEDYTGNVDTIGIRSPYEEGKRFAESLITMYVRKYKVNATIVRLFNTYGYNMAEDDQRVIPRFIRAALKDRPLTVHGEGTQTRTFCFIDDIVRGLLLVARKGKLGTVYNLGSSKETTIRELAEQIIEIACSESKIKFTKGLVHDHKRRHPSIGKIKKLGWIPQTPLKEGLVKTLRWFGS